MSGKWIVFGVVLVAAAAFFYFNYETLRDASLVSTIKSSASPSPTALDRVMTNAAQPGELARDIWHIGGIPHQQAVINFLQAKATSNPDLLEFTQRIIDDALRSPDIEVQRQALSLTRITGGHNAWSLMPVMLNDIDPQVRKMWLSHLVNGEREKSVATVFKLVDDPDPAVQRLAINTLGEWTDQDFYLDKQADDAERERVVGACRLWWSRQREHYDDPMTFTPHNPRTLPATDFALDDTNGTRTMLSSFFGRTIVLNFWSVTDANSKEMASILTQLRYRSGDELAVVGVATDGIADGSGAARYQADPAGNLPFDDRAGALITAEVDAQQINYPVLIDDTGQPTGAYVGFEPPVTIIIDPAGDIHRRFTGVRDLKTLEKMIQEAQSADQPVANPKP